MAVHGLRCSVRAAAKASQCGTHENAGVPPVRTATLVLSSPPSSRARHSSRTTSAMSGITTASSFFEGGGGASVRRERDYKSKIELLESELSKVRAALRTSPRPPALEGRRATCAPQACEQQLLRMCVCVCACARAWCVAAVTHDGRHDHVCGR
ncbi:hypothetical protein EON67_04205 [archaeon]|nr:MAG: hypothetical protein EON67_04205 [archaeon]